MQGSHFYTPPLTKVNRLIIIITAGTFVLNTILNQAMGLSLIPWLGLSPSGIHAGLLYQFLTYPLIEASLMGVIFEGLLVWFIGSELEMKWGSKFYLQFLMVAVLSSGIFYFLLGLIFPQMALYPLLGMTCFTYALLMAYAIIYSERHLTFMLLFPMKAKYFCMLLAAIQLYMGLTSPAGATSLSHIMAMIGAYVFLRYKSLKARGTTFESLQKQRHKNKMRSKLTIVPDDAEQGGDSKDPRYWQ